MAVYTNNRYKQLESFRETMSIDGGEDQFTGGFLIDATELINKAREKFLPACERITKGLTYMEINHTCKSYSS